MHPIKRSIEPFGDGGNVCVGGGVGEKVEAWF